ncbi:tetratricopeptide repeat protein [Nitzschia inconspicua]|uniref:Tetratricopeptide repeat protein n=1 Tax=Nitzschia inconspicua TaxID=303405 RepID=A0A9K3LW58_9STRA|nr:tetratricopeptide repeat protein [Nitzschia inconspicua]
MLPKQLDELNEAFSAPNDSFITSMIHKSLEDVEMARPRKKIRPEPAIDTVLLLTEIGITNYHLGDHSKAEQCFSQALCRLDTSFFPDASTAEAKYQQQASRSSVVATPQNDKARRTEYDEGMRVYQTPITFSDVSNKEQIVSTLHYNLGQTCMRQGSYENAASNFNRALSLCNVTSSESAMYVVMIFHCLGYCSYRTENDDQAITYYDQALSLVRATKLGPLALAASLNCVGVLYFNKQDKGTTIALSMFRESLDLYQSMSNQDVPTIATVLNNIGRVYYLQSEFQQALVMYEQSLALRQSILDVDSLDVAATLYNIGQTFHQLGRLEDSLARYKDFIHIARGVLGPSSKDMALVYKGIAEIYHELSDLKMALYFYSQALVVQMKEDGTSTDVATTLNKLGNICYEMKDFTTAMRHYKKGLEVEKKILPANHPHTIITQTNLAHIYKQLGQHDQALKAYMAVYKMQMVTFGANTLQVAETLSSIGLMQYHLRDYESSFESYQQALHIRRSCYGSDDHPDVASTLNSVGLVLFKQDMFDLAKKCFAESLRIRSKILGKDHRDVAILWYNIATIHFETGEDSVAIEMYKETLRVERTALGEDHPDVVLTLQHLGQVHQQLGQIEESLQYFNDALAIERKRPETRSSSMGRILNLLGNVYLQLGRTNEMMKCYVEASRLYEQNQKAGETLVIAGYNFYGLSKTNPPCAPVA